MNLNGTNILKNKNVDYCCIISKNSQIQAINLMQNIDLTVKSGTFKTKYQEQLFKL